MNKIKYFFLNKNKEILWPKHEVWNPKWMENKTNWKGIWRGRSKLVNIESWSYKNQDQDKFENEVKVQYFDGFNKGDSECRVQIVDWLIAYKESCSNQVKITAE